MTYIDVLSWLSAGLALLFGTMYCKVRLQALATYKRQIDKTETAQDEPYHQVFSRSCKLGMATLINWTVFFLFCMTWRYVNANQLLVDAFFPGLCAGVVSILAVAGCASYCNSKESDLNNKRRFG